MKIIIRTLLVLAFTFFLMSFFFTFQQDIFMKNISAKLLFWESPEIPIIYYITGALVGGLMMGLAVAAYDHFNMGLKVRGVRKELKVLKKE